MANLITEGWDWFPAGQTATARRQLINANGWFMFDNNPADSVIPFPITGRFDFGNACYLSGASGGGSNQFLAAPLDQDRSELFCGFAAYVGDTTSYTTSQGFRFFDAANGKFQVSVSLERYGVIRVWRGPTNPADPFGTRTLLASSRMGSFQENEWFFLEIHPLIASSGGGVEVRVNTVPKVQLTGANTQGSTVSTCDSVAFDWLSSGAPGSWSGGFDDIYVNDTTGAVNNSWLGNVRVKTQFMIANGATNDFSIGGTSPAATHWQSVLNSLLNDTKYEYSSNVGDIDLFVTDPILNSPLVHAVQVRMGLRQDDATQRVARALIRLGATNYVGSVDQFTNQTFTMYRERWELNPATGVAFTGAEVNAMQAGVKVQA